MPGGPGARGKVLVIVTQTCCRQRMGLIIHSTRLDHSTVHRVRRTQHAGRRGFDAHAPGQAQGLRPRTPAARSRRRTHAVRRSTAVASRRSRLGRRHPNVDVSPVRAARVRSPGGSARAWLVELRAVARRGHTRARPRKGRREGAGRDPSHSRPIKRPRARTQVLSRTLEVRDEEEPRKTNETNDEREKKEESAVVSRVYLRM